MNYGDETVVVGERTPMDRRKRVLPPSPRVGRPTGSRDTRKKPADVMKSSMLGAKDAQPVEDVAALVVDETRAYMNALMRQLRPNFINLNRGDYNDLMVDVITNIRQTVEGKVDEWRPSS
jgi:hypothetical protein